MSKVMVADRGGPSNNNSKQQLAPKVPILAHPYVPMGYVGEFQLSEDDTPTKNPAALAGATGRKGRIGDQNQSPVTKQNRAGNAMRFYWCKATNSVERFRGGVLA